MLVVDYATWGRIVVTGADRIRFLGGLTTVNVAALAPGKPTWGAVLSPKGRVLAMFQMHAHADHLELWCEGVLVDKTLGLLQKYAVMDDVEFAVHRDIAAQIWDPTRGPWQTTDAAGPAAATAQPWSHPAVNRARICAGFPLYGTDIDEDCFPFESALGQFLDYQKGCYVGQEPVFRVHAQGNAARAMRLVTVAGPAAAGDTVVHPLKPNAGTLTSTVLASEQAAIATVGLAYLHRTVFDQTSDWQVNGLDTTVTELPVVA